MNYPLITNIRRKFSEIITRLKVQFDSRRSAIRNRTRTFFADIDNHPRYQKFRRRAIELKTWLKVQFDAIDNTLLKKNLLHAIPFWVGSFITGLVAVIYARVFSWTEQSSIYIFNHLGWLFFILSPLCFLLAARMVSAFAPYARGSGIPQVTAAIELATPKEKHKVNRLLSLRIIFIKILSSLTMIFGGGVIGREGPTIQVSAAIFKKINEVLPAWYPKISKRNMLVTGAAAGLASAFNTPLGGIVFAIEELTKTHFNYFKSALLVGVIIAGLTTLNLLGPYLYLGYPQLNNIPLLIIAVIIPVALLSGICGSGMGRGVLYIFERKKYWKKNFRRYAFPVICGLIIAAIGYFIDVRATGSGKGIMVTALFTDDKHVAWYLPLLRLVGPVLSFSTGASGGIFAPSLSAGASIGAFASDFFQLSASETNLIILCGMVGCLTGITRSPFTSSILVIEMTNSHNIIFHLMLTAVLANLIANMVSRQSFYDELKDQYIREINMSENGWTKDADEG